jgi:hypothetical protein
MITLTLTEQPPVAHAVAHAVAQALGVQHAASGCVLVSSLVPVADPAPSHDLPDQKLVYVKEMC